MRALIQRASSAAVRVDGSVVGEIGAGLLILAGFEAADGEEDFEWTAQKIARLRVFPDEAGVMNRSLVEVSGEVLAVSQFTLFAATRKGNRPSWGRAAPPEIAKRQFDEFVQAVAAQIKTRVQTGVFGADMQVTLVNDGPVTLMLDSKLRE